MNRRLFLTSAAAFASSLVGFNPALAQLNSSRPIRVLVPLAPGGAVDPYARLIADHMARTLRRVVIVEHKPGANGNVGHQLNQRFGLDLVHVPAKGSGFQATDLMAGHVLFGFAQVQSTLPLIQEGKLRAIAVTSATRSRFLPGAPTFAELGQNEFTTTVWFGLMVRAGTSSAMVNGLLQAAQAAHADPDVRAKLEVQGYDMSGETGPGFAAAIRAQIERWGRLVRASGFRGDGG